MTIWQCFIWKRIDEIEDNTISTGFSMISSLTPACERSNSILACSSIFTRIIQAFIYVYKNIGNCMQNIGIKYTKLET